MGIKEQVRMIFVVRHDPVNKKEIRNFHGFYFICTTKWFIKTTGEEETNFKQKINIHSGEH